MSEEKKKEDKGFYNPIPSREDEAWGMRDLDKEFPIYGVFTSLFGGNWKELYRFAIRIAEDDVFLPTHFKGSPSTIMLVMLRGMEAGIPPIAALSLIIPTKGFFAMRGDALLDHIMASGNCTYWDIKESGSIKGKDYEVVITAKRQNPDGEIVKKFNFEMFERAKLFISDELYDQLGGAKAFTQSQNIRYEYPERVIKHFCMSFVIRDLFAKETSGLRSYEEVEHYKDYETVIMQDGKTVIAGKQIEFKSKSQKRSESLLDLMQKSGELDKNKDGRIEAVSKFHEDLHEKSMEKLFNGDGTIMEKEKYTPEELALCKGARAKFLNAILVDRKIYIEFLPNPNRISQQVKRELILAHQDGDEAFEKYINKQWNKKVYKAYKDAVLEFKGPDGDVDSDEVPQDKDRYHNPYGFEIPTIKDGNDKRELQESIDLANNIRNYVVEDNDEFLELIQSVPINDDGIQYKNIADFCTRAQSRDILSWLMSVYNG